MKQKSTQQLIADWVAAAIKQLELLDSTASETAEVGVTMEYPAEPAHGHYACSWALQAFGKLRQHAASPRELATMVAAAIPKLQDFDPQVVERVEVAGPGFINFFLQPAHLQQVVSATSKQLSLLQDQAGQRVIIEFTDPNPFKEFHIGHLYSNVVGEAIAKLTESRGSQVHRVCYQGDVGMHVAKSLWGLEQLLAERYPGQTAAKVLEDLSQQPLSARVKLLGQAYAKGATAYEQDDLVEQSDAQSQDSTQPVVSPKQAMKDINFLTFVVAQQQLIAERNWQPQVAYQNLVELDSDRLEQVRLLYTKGRTWSLEYFDQMYTRAGMQFDDFFFESLVGEFGLQLVRSHLKTPRNPEGVFLESQGAVIFPGSQYGLHDRVFVNSLGLPTYEAKELGLAPEKYRRWPHDRSIIITGNEIDEYFKVLLKALSFTNPELSSKTQHLSHGMVKLPQGKMSSRTGKVLTGEWLMNEAQQRILTQLDQQRPEMSPEMRLQVAEQVAMGAIKYAFLRSGIGRDIAFDFDESLSLSGNSGPYIQYMAVRCRSILNKAGSEALDQALAQDQASDSSWQPNSEELLVMILIQRLPEIVLQAAADVSPHLLAGQLYALAQAFSVFYDRHQVMGHPQRLVLTASVLRSLESGLQLLGIEVPEQM